MPRAIEPGPLRPSEQTSKTEGGKGISPSLQSNKNIAQNYVIEGRGRHLLGVGALPTFSDKAPQTVSVHVSQTVQPLLAKIKYHP
jgi:hypothetical protein